MKKVLLILLISCSIVVLSQERTTIKGNIYTFDGKPLEGVSFNFNNGASGFSSLNGRVSIIGKFKPGGNYHCTFTKNGFKQLRSIVVTVNDDLYFGDFWMCPDTTNCEMSKLIVIKENEEDIFMQIDGGNRLSLDRPQNRYNLGDKQLNSTVNIVFSLEGYCTEIRNLRLSGNNIIIINLKKKCELNIILDSTPALSYREQRWITGFIDPSNDYARRYQYYNKLSNNNISRFSVLFHILRGKLLEMNDDNDFMSEYILARSAFCKGISRTEEESINLLINSNNSILEWLSKKTNSKCFE